MRNLKRFLLSFFAGGLLAFSITGTALAWNPFSQEVCGQNGASNTTLCQTNTGANPISGRDGAILKATRIILILTGVAAIVAIIIGGLMFILSGGDPAKVNTAKQTVLYAVIGIIVAALAQAIVSFVLSKL